jgi:predicted phosphodiesterase
LALSDLHLGRKNGRVKDPNTLTPLVEGFDRVLLLGDIVDHWYLREEQVKEWEEGLLRAIRRAGVEEILWFRGNHDANRADGMDYALIDRILYIHGHAAFSRLRGKGDLKERIGELNRRKFGPHRRASRMDKAGWRIVEGAYERLPQHLARLLFWSRLARRRLAGLARQAAPDPLGLGAIVFGHTHCAGFGQWDGLDLYNLGGWMTNTQPCGFESEGLEVRLRAVEFRAGRPRWGRCLARRGYR